MPFVQSRFAARYSRGFLLTAIPWLLIGGFWGIARAVGGLPQASEVPEWLQVVLMCLGCWSSSCSAPLPSTG
jgi:hypothetical protein